jgi:hypothetical protein
MTTKTDNAPDHKGPQDTEASTLALLTAMADTTWRMFTPPALLVSGGLWLDLKYHTKPWATIGGAVAGMWLAILLVRQQLGKKS